ncbi:MAG: AraC family transcriptional regulator [Betaproteobacteria bacterium]|nr:AraC family transcriptional regulator [Betaproteobacteria bacterium]
MDQLTENLAAPKFWWDDTLPFIEARSVLDGRKVCYAKHSHQTFSIGAITNGCCTYLNGKTTEPIDAGSVTLMNPEEAHACNPLKDQPWSYHMLYVDTSWLTALQHEQGFSPNQDFRAFSKRVTTDPGLYAGLDRLYATLVSDRTESLQKHCAVLSFFEQVQQTLDPAPLTPRRENNRKLACAAEYIRENSAQTLKLDDICAAAGLSSSYLIRAFKQCYGMTPHAYLTNCRIEYSRAQLKRGRAIAEVAAAAGFADQAHLQRTFKQFVAATPGQYRSLGFSIR